MRMTGRMMGRKTASAGQSGRGAMTALAMVLALGACSTVEGGWDYVFGDDQPATVAPSAEGSAATSEPEEAPAAAAPTGPVPEGLRGEPSPPDYGPGQRRTPTSTRALNDQPAPAATPRRTVAESAAPAADPTPAPVAAPAAAPASLAPVRAAAPAPSPAATASRVQRAEIAPPPAPPPAAPAPAVAPVRQTAAPAPALAPAQSAAPLVPTTPAGEVLANSPRPSVPELAAAPPQLNIPPASAGATPRLLAPPVANAGRSDLLISPPTMGGGVGPGLDDLGTTVIGGDGRVVSGGAPPLVAPSAPTLAAEPYGFDIVPPEMPLAMTGAETLVATIQFEHGSSSVSARERRLLRQVVEMQRQYGGVLQVVGHASSRTADMSMDRHMMVNYATSARRAEAVANTLRSLGAADGSVVVVAQSDNVPIYREIMPSGEAGNRRAEVYLVN